MPTWLDFLLACGLFLIGLRLSAFFSGSETGFYRLSVLRLSIDARAGDRPSERLLWFARNPAYFVATCLVGNNVANYLTTAAIGWGLVALFGATTDLLEVAATLMISPIIFLFGELLPKNIYYLAPMSRSQQNIRWFRYFFRAFLPISAPLVQLTRVFERFSGQSHQPTELVLGRSRLVQLMQQGHREGVLTDLQSRLAHGLLQLAPQSVMSSMIPTPRVLGVSESSSQAEILDFARRFGLSAVAVHRADDEQGWFGYAFVAELILNQTGRPIIHSMPVIPYQTSKLEALNRMQLLDASYGVVVRNEEILGIVARNGLVEQIYRPEVGLASRALA